MKAKVIQDKPGDVIIKQTNNASYKFRVKFYKHTLSLEKGLKYFPDTLDYELDTIVYYVDYSIFQFKRRKL